MSGQHIPRAFWWSSWDPPDRRCYTRLLSYTRLYGPHIDIRSSHSYAVPQDLTSLFLLLPPYQNWLFSGDCPCCWGLGNTSPRPFWCSSRNPPEEEAAQIYFRVIQDSIASHVDIHHHPHSLPVSQELSSFSSLDLIKTGCAAVTVSVVKPLATQHPKGFLI